VLHFKIEGGSVFGTATLDLRGKAGFRPLFPRGCGKTMGFWNSLHSLNISKNMAHNTLYMN
jgi:hypothetical protein